MRIDPGLWGDLESWAQDELRSVNGQIEYLLRQAVQKRKGLVDQSGPVDNEQGSETSRQTKRFGGARKHK